MNYEKENLIKLGEEEKRIFVVGNPALDRIEDVKLLNRESVISTITSRNIDEKYWSNIMKSRGGEDNNKTIRFKRTDTMA